MSILNAMEMFTLQWLILCYLNFTSVTYLKTEEAGGWGEGEKDMALDGLHFFLWDSKKPSSSQQHAELSPCQGLW